MSAQSYDRAGWWCVGGREAVSLRWDGSLESVRTLHRLSLLRNLRRPRLLLNYRRWLSSRNVLPKACLAISSPSPQHALHSALKRPLNPPRPPIPPRSFLHHLRNLVQRLRPEAPRSLRAEFEMELKAGIDAQRKRWSRSSVEKKAVFDLRGANRARVLAVRSL